MLKLKQVVDKQRDDLRAKAQEITTISKEVEAVRIPLCIIQYSHTEHLLSMNE